MNLSVKKYGDAVIEGIKTFRRFIVRKSDGTAVIKAGDGFDGVAIVGDVNVDGVVTAAAIAADNISTNGFDLQDADSMGTLAWTDGTRTFSISVTAGQNSYHFWCDGTKITKTTTQSVVIPDVTGIYYIYFDNDGNLQYVLDSSIPTEAFYEYALTGIVRWNKTQNSGGAGDERHGIVMGGATHLANHETFGALYVRGLDIEGLAGGSKTYTQTTSGVYRDEDIRHSLPAQSTHPYMYRLGTAGEWTTVAATNEVGLKEGGDTWYSWNEWTGATWQLTEGGVLSDYFITFFVGSPSIIAGTGIVKIVGHNAYANVATARAAIESELSTLRLEGLPGPEIVFLYAVIVKRNGELQELSDGSLYHNLRNTAGGGLGGDSADTKYAEDVPTDTTNFDGALTSADINIQLALETLDDEVGDMETRASEIFTSSGTWTRPAGVGEVSIILVGGGGGGHEDNVTTEMAGGGGAEVSVHTNLPVTTDLTVTIGAGGAAETDGGDSTITGGPVNISASGGVKGTTTSGGAGGGVASIVSQPGGAGGGGVNDDGGNCEGFADGGAGNSHGGGGGGSFGLGGAGAVSDATNGSVGTKGGGGGGCSTSDTPGSGGDGYCVIFWEA